MKADRHLARPLTPRRLSGALLFSLALLQSPMARDALLRALARYLSGQHEVSGLVVLRNPRRPRARVLDHLGAWTRPTLVDAVRPLALALAELGIRPGRAARKEARD